MNNIGYKLTILRTKKSIRCFNTCAILERTHRANYRVQKSAEIARREKEASDEFPIDFTAPSTRKTRAVGFKECLLNKNLSELRFKYPEFLPETLIEHRHKIKDHLQREDMLKRREIIDIPEFYVGSILKVVVSDPYAPGKVSFFVGICIGREGQGLKANFTLRNHIDGEGIEIRYDLYNPTIRMIEVLRLEKRLDDQLFYLRDASPEYSTFPLNMQPEPHQEGTPVPINPIRVKMKPFPWSRHWEKRFPKIYGVETLENVPDYNYRTSRRSHNVNEKYDLMKEYREHIPEEDQLEIWESIHERAEKLAEIRKVERKRRVLESMIKNT